MAASTATEEHQNGKLYEWKELKKETPLVTKEEREEERKVLFTVKSFLQPVLIGFRITR